MGPPGHIPWRAMHAYCEAKGVRGDDQDSFVELVKAMDDTYLEHVSRQLDRNRGDGSGIGNGDA